MEIQKYTGVLADIIALVSEAGDLPEIRLVKVTREEMDELVNSHAFRTTVSTYYGTSTTMVFSEIKADHQGNIISMYLNNILIAVGAEDPTGPISEITYPELPSSNNAEITFTKDGDMLVGPGNPSSGFVVGSNANIEMALAVRKLNDATNYCDALGHFTIPLTDMEDWTFAFSVGSKNAGIPNVTDMYTVKLFIDVNPVAGQHTTVVWELKYVDGFIRGNPVKNYVWYRNNEPMVFDGATDDARTVTQSVQKYSSLLISQLIPGYVKRNEQGAPFGNFTLRLEATPKIGPDYTPVNVEAVANISKKAATPPIRKTFLVGTDSGLIVQHPTGPFLPSTVTAKIRDVAFGAEKYVAVGAGVFVSPDKNVWTEMTFGFGECSQVVFVGGKFYASVDGAGIYALNGETWTLLIESDKEFTQAIDAGGVPLFSTTDGYIIDARNGTTKLVKAGVLHIAYSGKLFAAVNVGETLETFSGANMQSLVSAGTSTLDNLTLNDFYADAKGVIVGVGKMNDAQPVVVIFRNNKWLFAFLDTDGVMTHVVNNAVSIGSGIHTTTDYINFVDYHDVGAAITALLYA